MYAVVEYNNYRKEQDFEIKLTTHDLEYAKKVVFHNAKKSIPKDDRLYKITSNIEEYYIHPKHECIIEYMVIEVEKHENKNKFKMKASYSTVFSVIQLENYENLELEDIDENLICDNYYLDEDEDDDDEEDS